MQIVRTILWLLLLAALLLFSWANWEPGVTVRIWEGIVVDTRLPAIVILSFLAGLVPMWLYHRGVKWRLSRRIRALEEAARTSALAPAAHDEAVPHGRTHTAAEADTATEVRGDHDRPRPFDKSL